MKSVSGGKASRAGPFIYYKMPWGISFIGYPLGKPFVLEELSNLLWLVIKKESAQKISLITPELPEINSDMGSIEHDGYYRLNLTNYNPPPKRLYMVRRAQRDLTVEVGYEVTKRHVHLIKSFLETRNLSPPMEKIYLKIPNYIKSSSSVLIASAYTASGGLAAFSVMDLGSDQYSFYMFNITSSDDYVPGASDLLLYKLITLSIKEGKRYLNLGLGINNGIRMFKKGWGGILFLNYIHATIEQESLSSTLDKVFHKL